LDLLPLEIALEGVDPLLRTVVLSSCSIALCAKPRLGLTRVVSLLAKPLDHRDVLTGFRLQRGDLLLGHQLQPPLLLKLALEVEDLLAGLSILLMQLITLRHGLRGVLAILTRPLKQVQDHLLRLLGVMTSLCLPGPKVGRLRDEVVLGLLLSMEVQGLVLGTHHQQPRKEHKSEATKQEAATRA
jgi:hypothetical protein